MANFLAGVLQQDTNRHPSDAVWVNCQQMDLLLGGSSGSRGGIIEWDDFDTLNGSGANAGVGRYKVVGTNGTVTLLASDDGGVARLATSTTANNESYLCGGQAAGVIGQLTTNTVNEFWFEARVRYQDIVNSGTFIGLTRPADMASGFIVNGATAMIASSADYVGFSQYQGTPTVLNIVYNTAGTETVYKAGAITGGIVVNTWYKLGIHYFANRDSNNVRFYVNGVEIANTAGTKGVQASATNFPSAVKMHVIAAAKTSGTTATNMEIDWWKYAMVIENQ